MIYYFKKIVKSAMYGAFAFDPIRRYCRSKIRETGIVVLMYHELADDDCDIEAWTVVKKSDFEMQMDYLRKYFDIISLEEAVTRVEDLHGMQKPAAVITFDDGYAGNKRILLPTIQAMNIPVTVFVSTQAVQEQISYWYDRLLNALAGNEIINIELRHVALNDYCINKFKGQRNWMEIQRLLTDLKTLQPIIREAVVDDILVQCNADRFHDTRMMPLTIKGVQELAACPLVTIGAHSHCHNILPQLSRNDIQESIRTSKELLETWTGRQIRHFAYPNGDYNTDVIQALQSLGFSASVTTAPHVWKSSESLFTIPRLGIGRYDSLNVFKVKTTGGFASCIR